MSAVQNNMDDAMYATYKLGLEHGKEICRRDITAETNEMLERCSRVGFGLLMEESDFYEEFNKIHCGIRKLTAGIEAIK